ncbi:acyl-CoA dehydrogenase [Amycolatopsis alkalitolerans]|uniref:Acyl-CoA dehydrogenase n=2 Tax=Amycolatopsis alkalitolerans TaxID=2547244 RepID=A0A5C4MAW9_9PSEU|nr:acyl-CoA dehydrogenase [Amycolatopsis alkalitolerans]
MLSAVVADAGHLPADEHPADIAVLRRRLAELGVWTLGATMDGDPAGDELAAIAFARLGRSWAALAWASVQAHAAVDVVGDSELSAAIRAGDSAVAVLDQSSAVVHMTARDGWLSGRIDRLDPAGERPHVILLGEGSARVIPAEALRFEPLRRTGLDGALTVSAETTEAVREADVTRAGVDTTAARIRLRLGAAAIAAGIADAAAEAALSYSAQREQFGAPLTALPTVRDALFLSSGAATTALRQVLRPRDCSAWQAAAVLDSLCEQAIDTCALAVQSHGGYGYLAEYPVERLLRDAVSLRAAADVAGARRAAASELAGHPRTDSGKDRT